MSEFNLIIHFSAIWVNFGDTYAAPVSTGERVCFWSATSRSVGLSVHLSVTLMIQSTSSKDQDVSIPGSGEPVVPRRVEICFSCRSKSMLMVCNIRSRWLWIIVSVFHRRWVLKITRRSLTKLWLVWFSIIAVTASLLLDLIIIIILILISRWNLRPSLTARYCSLLIYLVCYFVPHMFFVTCVIYNNNNNNNHKRSRCLHCHPVRAVLSSSA